MGCAEPRWQALAGPYVGGRLSEDERRAFEDHYFACDPCFQEVEGLQKAWPTEKGDREGTTKPRAAAQGMHGWWPAALAAALAVALGLGVWLWSREGSSPSSPADGVPVASGERPADDTPAADASGTALDTDATEPTTGEPFDGGVTFTIAEIEPPRYEPIVLRGAEGDADAQFVAGMERYQRGEYGAAVPLLESAAQLDPDTPRIQFFLGASHLLAGEAAPALDRLGRVVALGTTPYLEEAKLLRAKAHLVEGDANRAIEELEQVIAMKGDHEFEALALMARVRPKG